MILLVWSPTHELKPEKNVDTHRESVIEECATVNTTEEHTIVNTESHEIDVRKSTRVSKPPAWLQDYIIPGKDKGVNCCRYPIYVVIGYDGLSFKYQSYLSKISIEEEPTSYGAAAKDTKWANPMKAEIKALEDNKTWDIVPLPKGKKVIGCKLIYKIKYNAS